MQRAEKRSREVWLASFATAFIVLVEWVMARKVSLCGTPDSCAYLALGESLSRHQGFRENFLFQYQFVSPHLPTHGIEYWRPGTSFFLLLAQPFGGVTLHSSLVITMLAGICLALAAWRIAIDSTGSPRVACAAYLLCLVLPPLWDAGLSPDSALYYGAFVAWFLALLRVDFRSYWEDLGALVCVAGVSLIRNDAILLLVPLLAVLFMRRRRATSRGASLGYAALLLGGFVIANLPMPIIDHAVLGKAFPPGTGGALYLTSLSDLSAYGKVINLNTMLAQGPGTLLKLRVTTLPQMLYRILWVVVGFGIVFLPLLAIRRRSPSALPETALPELTAGLAFLVAVVGVYGLVLPAVGGFSALRSVNGLLPLVSLLIVTAILRLEASPKTRLTLFASVFTFYFLHGMMSNRRVVQDSAPAVASMQAIVSALAGQGLSPQSDVVIMTDDPAQFSVTTGYAALPLPSNGWNATRQAITDLKPARVLLTDSEYTAWQEQLGSIPARRIPAAGRVLLSPTR